MDPVKKLDEMLTEAGIPHEYIVERWADTEGTCGITYIMPGHVSCEADKYIRNQIIYGKYEDGVWKLDAIWQRGSYGRHGHLLEVYGEMIGGDPKVYTTEEVFRMIEADWKKQ